MLAPPRSASADVLLGLDDAGAELWRIAPPADTLAQLHAVGDELLVLTPDSVHLVEAATGTARTVSKVPGGEVVLATATREAVLVARQGTHPQLLRIERTDGTVTWRQGVRASALAVVDGVALDCTAGGNVEARALDDGRPAWSFGLGFRCTSLWSVPTGPGQPARVMAAGQHGRFVVFEADPSPAPAERFTARGRVLVDGKPQRGVAVHVGDDVDLTDARGRYQVRARGRGTIQVWVDLPPSAAGPGRVINWEPTDTIALSGARSYRRDLVTDTGPEDH